MEDGVALSAIFQPYNDGLHFQTSDILMETNKETVIGECMLGYAGSAFVSGSTV